MEGWIKLHRQFTKWEWYNDINTCRLFLHLLIIANHEDQKWRGIVIKRGQRLTSLGHLAKETGLTVQNVRTSIKKLKSTSELTSKPTNKNTLITICNYDKYQDKVTNKLTSQLTNDQQTTNKQLTTNKNVKNVKNDKKKEKIYKKEDSDNPLWQGFCGNCEMLELKNRVKPDLYLQAIQEFSKKGSATKQVKECLVWCKANDKKIVTIMRIRNWFNNWVAFNKTKELKQMTERQDKKMTQKNFTKPNLTPKWTPPT